MTTPDPREVDRLIASDPALVRLLAEYVEGVTNPKPAAPPKPNPRRTTSKPTTKPKPPPSRKAPMRTVKKKPPPAPKRRGVSIHIEDVPEPTTTWTERQRLYKLSEPKRTATDAHNVDEPTPCSTCGGPVDKLEAEWWGPWRRHPSCARIVARSASRLPVVTSFLGIAEVDAVTAALTEYRIPLYSEGHAEPTYLPEDRKRDREPWAHVDRKALLSAISGAATEAAEREIARPCDLGRCAWCGRIESVEWTAYGHSWADGSEAPLCADCSPVYERRGHPSPQYPEDARTALGEALSGVPAQLGSDGTPGLLAYIEAEGAGDGTAWSHLPPEAVDAFRWAEWGRYGGRYAPPERRAEALDRARQIDAERAAGIAAREAEADAFGFLRET